MFGNKHILQEFDCRYDLNGLMLGKISHVDMKGFWITKKTV